MTRRSPRFHRGNVDALAGVGIVQGDVAGATGSATITIDEADNSVDFEIDDTEVTGPRYRTPHRAR